MKMVIYAVRLTCNNNKEQHSPQNSAQRKMRTAIICLSLTDHYFHSFLKKRYFSETSDSPFLGFRFVFALGFFL